MGDTCTVKCSGGTIAVGNSSGSNQQKESFTRQCVPAENLDDKHNRWVVNGTLTPYKEDLIELDCPSKEILLIPNISRKMIKTGFFLKY